MRVAPRQSGAATGIQCPKSVDESIDLMPLT
jgi:hypothetical protein